MNVFVCFPTTNKIFSYETDLKLEPGNIVLAEADQIIEKGFVLDKSGANDETEVANGQILRILTDDDRKKTCLLKRQARELILDSEKKVFRHGLDMKILDAEISFDEKKLTFFSPLLAALIFAVWSPIWSKVTIS